MNPQSNLQYPQFLVGTVAQRLISFGYYECAFGLLQGRQCRVFYDQVMQLEE